MNKNSQPTANDQDCAANMSPLSGILVAGRHTIRQAVAIELIDAYTHRTNRSLLANFIGALFLAYGMSTPSNAHRITVWLIAIVLSLCVSYAVNYFYTSDREKTVDLDQRLICAQVVAASLNGLIWGWGGVLFYSGRLEYDLLLSIAMCCVAAMAVTTRSTIRYAALTMSTFVLLPPTFHLLSAAGTFFPLLGLGGVLFVGAMIWFAVATNEMLFSAINVNQRNIDLARELTLKNQALELSIARIEESARVDYLTGCYNRSHLMRRLMEEGARAEPLDHPFSFVLIDVDHFKDVNDEHGHLFGDDVLKAVARQIHCSVRRMDVVARFGGEEFACLLPDASHDEALLIAERIRGVIAATPVVIGATCASVTVSVGVSHWHPSCSIEKLIHEADKALYQAKRNGRDRVMVAANNIATSQSGR